MNKFLILTFCIVLSVSLLSCSEAPDFMKEAIIRKKKTTQYGSTYFLKDANGMYGGTEWGAVKFQAPESFAKVGDVIIFKDGVLKAK